MTSRARFISAYPVATLTMSGEEVIFAESLSTGSLRDIDATLSASRVTVIYYFDVPETLSEIRAAIDKAAGFASICPIFNLATPASAGAHRARPLESFSINGYVPILEEGFAIKIPFSAAPWQCTFNL